MKSVKPNRRHVSHDGSVLEYNYQTNEWIIVQQDTHHDNKDNNDDNFVPKSLRGRLFNIYDYFPYLYTKQIMNLDALTILESTFKINGNVLYVGNMINNELKTRHTLKQQHGDTGNNIWDTSVVFVKCLEYNTFHKHADKFSKILNVSNKNVLELGTGTGFLGLSTIHCDANHVWLTDLRYCIQNIETNVDKNRFIWDKKYDNTQNEVCDNKTNPFKKVDVFELDWFNAEKSLSKFNNIKKNSVDIIIGSDIIWVQDLVPALVNTLEYLYKNILNKDGVIIIGEQIRSNIVSELFWNLMKSKGFYKYEISRKLYHPDFVADAIEMSIVSHNKL